ncbi:MAG: hypothetical protein AB7V50_06670 [Vampirovibrionia bacterium]
MISSIQNTHSRFIHSFKGDLMVDKPDSFIDSEVISFITNRMIKAKDSDELKDAIRIFRKKYENIYNRGADKWQNPKYHQYTVTDHMLKSMEKMVSIIKGEHKELDHLLTPSQKDLLLKNFDENVAGVNKGALLVLAMGFHDLDKFFFSKPLIDRVGKRLPFQFDNHHTYLKDRIKPDSNYWSFEFEPAKAVNLFRDTAKDMNLPEPAIKYASDVLLNHDNPLRCIIWEVENGKNNVSKLFDDMKQKTPMSLDELAIIYLADQSAKGGDGWLDHLEDVSPWRAMFKSLVAQRPLSDLEILLKNKEKP